MNKKIVVSLLGILLSLVLSVVVLSPSTVMAAAGLSALDASALDKVQNEAVETVKSGLKDLAEKLDKSKKASYTSKDGYVVIDAEKDSESVKVTIKADASGLPSNLDYKDISKVVKAIKDYFKPAFTENQTKSLYGLLIGDAYAQYKKGNMKINITKEYEGLTIECSGNVDTGTLTLNLKGTLGEKTCQPSKSKTTGMKVLPL